MIGEKQHFAGIRRQNRHFNYWSRTTQLYLYVQKNIGYLPSWVRNPGNILFLPPFISLTTLWRSNKLYFPFHTLHKVSFVSFVSLYFTDENPQATVLPHWLLRVQFSKTVWVEVVWSLCGPIRGQYNIFIRIVLKLLKKVAHQPFVALHWCCS